MVSLVPAGEEALPGLRSKLGQGVSNLASSGRLGKCTDLKRNFRVKGFQEAGSEVSLALDQI